VNFSELVLMRQHPQTEVRASEDMAVNIREEVLTICVSLYAVSTFECFAHAGTTCACGISSNMPHQLQVSGRLYK
jgi:hypothetical protein